MSIHEHEATRKIGVKKFYKETKRFDHLKKITGILDLWINPKTGLIREDYTDSRACPVCGESDHRTAFIKEGFVHAVCSRCGMMYVQNTLKADKVDQLYRDSDYINAWFHVLMSDMQKKFDRVKFEEGLKLIEASGKGKVLDVGSSIGFFLEIARERGWDVTGVELNKMAAGESKRLGIRTIEQPLDDKLFGDEKFDAVTSWDVIEHIVDCRNVVKNIHRVLKPGGLFLLAVPNSNSIAARILQEKCVMFAGFAHVNIFNPETLTKFMEQLGFEKVSLQTYISEIHIINNYLEYSDPYKGESENKDDILGLISFDDVHKNLLGYEILGVFRKK